MDNLTKHNPLLQQPSTCLKPLLNKFLANNKESEDFMKDIFMNYLLEKQVKIRLGYFLQDMIKPGLHFLLLFLGLILSVAVIPSIIFLKFCTRAKNAVKHQFLFCVESFFLLTICNCLLLGSLLYIQTSNQILVAVRQYPQLTHNVIENMQTSIIDYKVQVQRAKETSNSKRNFIIDEVDFIPSNVVLILHDQLNPELYFLRRNLNITLEIIKSRDVPKKFDSVNWNKFERFLHEFPKYIVETLKTDSDHKKNANETFDVMKSINNDLQQLFNYYDNFLENFEKNYVKFIASDLSDFVKYVPNMNIVEKPVKNVINALSRINHTLTAINKKAINFDSFIKSFIFTGFPFQVRVNLLRIILLIPAILTIFYLLLILFGSFFGLRELQVLLKNPNEKITETSVYLFKIAALFSALFIWILFCLAIGFYILFWPIAGICKSVKDGRLVTNYFDNTSNWNNDTWLGFTFNHSSEFQNIKLQSVLTACKNKSTIMEIINFDKERQLFKIDRLVLQTPKLKFTFRNFLKKIVFPTAEHFNIIMKRFDELSRRNIEKIKKYRKDQEIGVQSFLVSEILTNIHNITGDFKASWFNKLRPLIEMNFPGNTFEKIFDRNKSSFKDLDVILKNYLGPLKEQYKLQYIKERIYLVKLLTENIKDKIAYMSFGQDTPVDDYFESLTRIINDIYNNMYFCNKFMMQNKIGKCTSFSNSYDLIKVTVCDDFILILLSASLSLAIMAFSLLLGVLLTCRMTQYIKGTFDFYKLIKCSDRRYSEEKAKLMSAPKEMITNTESII